MNDVIQILEQIALVLWSCASIISAVLALLIATAMEKDGPRRLALWIFLMSMGSTAGALVVLYQLP